MGQKVQGSSFSSTARDAPELATLQGLVAASFGVCCVAAASSHAPELAALQQQASRSKQASFGARLRSLLRCGKQASKKKKKTSYLFVCAWVPLQLQQLRSSSSCSNSTATAPAPTPQPPEVSGALAME